MESEWGHGYFLGVSPGTTEYLIGTSADVYSRATMRRLEEDKAFDTAVIKELDIRGRDPEVPQCRTELMRTQRS